MRASAASNPPVLAVLAAAGWLATPGECRPSFFNCDPSSWVPTTRVPTMGQSILPAGTGDSCVVTGAPAAYSGGQTYQITVTSSQARMGNILVTSHGVLAGQTTNAQQAGCSTAGNSGATITTGSVVHSWTAPATGSGDVTFDAL